MARRTNSKIEAAAFKQAHDIVANIAPVWLNSMTPEQSALATHEVIMSTLRVVGQAAQQALDLEDEK